VIATSVFLYPGQGGYSRDLLARVAAGSPAAKDACVTVAEIARSEMFIDLSPLTQDSIDLPELLDRAPDALQMAIYTASVASALEVSEAGVTPAVHIGHSFGEIAALTVGGVCSVADGARIVARRVRALSALPARSGFMLSVNAEHDRVRRLIEFLSEPEMAIAGINGERQIVLSGAVPAMERAAGVLEATGITAVRLPSPYPFHSPVLEPIVAAFESSLRDITWSAPTSAVYSPIEGRFYEPGDDFAAMVASHLVRPFDFYSAVRRVSADGARLFVECGGRQTLTGIIAQVLSDRSGWTAVTTDRGYPNGATTAAIFELAAGDAAIFELAAGDKGQARDKLRAILDGTSAPGVFERFWDIEGGRLFQQLRESFSTFMRDEQPTGGPRSERVPEQRDLPPPVVPAMPMGASQDAGPVAAAPAAAGAGPTTPASPAPASPAPASPAPADGDRIFTELARLYGEALEYPLEVFGADTELEAELGVDSVKQTDLLSRVAKRYALPSPPEGFRIVDYPTFGHVVELVVDSHTARV
jgi:malonyl CoA-acyl carrier protein transacylase